VEASFPMALISSVGSITRSCCIMESETKTPEWIGGQEQRRGAYLDKLTILEFNALRCITDEAAHEKNAQRHR
jgi:hypothetical protein